MAIKAAELTRNVCAVLRAAELKLQRAKHDTTGDEDQSRFGSSKQPDLALGRGVRNGTEQREQLHTSTATRSAFQATLAVCGRARHNTDLCLRVHLGFGHHARNVANRHRLRLRLRNTTQPATVSSCQRMSKNNTTTLRH